MALMNCPECGGQVSDHAKACPHCGYVLTNEVKEVDAPTPDPTQIKGFNKTGSATQTVIGMLFMFAGFVFLFMIWPLAIPVFAVGAWLLNEGSKAYAPKVEVECPFCKKSGLMERKQTIYACPNCKKQSVREDDHLYPML